MTEDITLSSNKILLYYKIILFKIVYGFQEIATLIPMPLARLVKASHVTVANLKVT